MAELCTRLLGLCRRSIAASADRGTTPHGGGGGANQEEAIKQDQGEHDEGEEEEAVFSIIMNLLEGTLVRPALDCDKGSARS